MIVTFFVLCAEAVFRTINPYENSNEQLVKSFFETVYRKIQYTIRYNMGSKIEDQNSARLLYLIRNDYLHNGNSIGLFFKDDKEIENVYNVGSFEYRPVSNVRELTREIIECSLTYKDFRDIFLEAFISNICKYCKNQFEFLNRQEIDKKKAIMHLRYEKEVFDKCAELIMNEKDNKLKIIYTESFLLHARNLSYFLSKGKQYLTDINWSDFISKPIKIKFLEGQGLRQINKFLMHMTRERIDFKTPD